MAEAIYRDFRDRDSLYAQYDNRSMIAAEALDAIKARQAERSDACRAGAGRQALDLAYGSHPRERLDLFLPEADGAPLFAFIHGGYWQWNDKEPFAFLGEHLVPAGAAFANIEYALCPGVTLTELTQQIRRAIAYLWREAGRFGYDRERIVVSGHSAGGHLTAMAMATDWPAFGDDLPAGTVAGGLPISGVYDIEPLRHTPLNDAVRMDAAEARALSPIFLEPATTAPMAVVAGGDESDEFRRQARDFAGEWRAFGVEAEVLIVPGTDHFTVLDTLAEPGHPTVQAALGLLGI
ncbi:MAG: alpha/beta hydrolase [Defluviicoccus sp.]|nr:alpha/beta hydrolase [Defluviicoccus sp.]